MTASLLGTVSEAIDLNGRKVIIIREDTLTLPPGIDLEEFVTPGAESEEFFSWRPVPSHDVEEGFNHPINSQLLMQYQEDNAWMSAVVDQFLDELALFRLPVQKRINLGLLSELLETKLYSRGIEIPFEFGVRPAGSDSIL